MEETKNTESNASCNCEPGCCTPSKPSRWSRYLLIAILAIALGIIVIKFTSGENNLLRSSGKDAIGCDSTVTDSQGGKPCSGQDSDCCSKK